MTDAVEEEVEGFVCKWGNCEEAPFASTQALDNHVEKDHIKVRKAAAAASKDQKGMVCEWKECLSDKIYRDSWNLVTHVRYKHSHYKPFECTVAGCDKAFVQLHQMKKHAKTPHEGAAAAPRARARGRKPKRKVSRQAESSESDYDEEVGQMLGANAPGVKKGRQAGPDEAVADEEGALDARTALRLRAVSPLEHDALEGLLEGDRLAMVVSPTSLLASNTELRPMSNVGRALLWSPLGSLAPTVQTPTFGSTPTPPVLGEHYPDEDSPAPTFTAKPPTALLKPSLSRPPALDPTN